MSVEIRENTQRQEQYWNRMTQFKFDLNYYSYEFKHCVKCQRWIKGGFLFLTALFTGAWTTWGEMEAVKWVCSIAIFILQAVNSISEIFPYETRKGELREMSSLLEPIYDDMEADWFQVSAADLDDDEITAKILAYSKKIRSIKRHYFKDDAIPDNKKIKAKAKEETDLYFQTRF